MFLVKLTFGFVFLIAGANLLVKGAVAFSEKMALNRFLVGVVIVAAGTSLPELVVVLFASVHGESGGFVIGSVLGSNISNIFLVLGMLTLFYQVPVRKELLKQELVANFLAFGLVVMLIALSTFLSPTPREPATWMFSRFAGAVLLGFFLLYLLFLFKNNTAPKVTFEPDELKQLSSFRASGLVLFGILGLAFGGEWVVQGASYLAYEVLQVSHSLVGLTLVALATSLPELFTTLMAGKKKEIELGLGNVLGSNLFNLCFILGTAVLVRPFTFPGFLQQDFLVCFLSLLFTLCLVLAALRKKSPALQSVRAAPFPFLSWGTGVFFLATYVGYLAFLLWRG